MKEKSKKNSITVDLLSMTQYEIDILSFLLSIGAHEKRKQLQYHHRVYTSSIHHKVEREFVDIDLYNRTMESLHRKGLISIDGGFVRIVTDENNGR